METETDPNKLQVQNVNNKENFQVYQIKKTIMERANDEKKYMTSTNDRNTHNFNLNFTNYFFKDIVLVLILFLYLIFVI